ncbi:DUF805 domain-containing protein [Salaquimonas pukyongi]|uniref:DUF805 domain-containing protein n=1 Tax=Salaquimonas pukyongi TaxID=2712698 RepID=UPI00096B923A|nr:DUF805 domain-containing protein [Salaquimonas pukyongi]
MAAQKRKPGYAPEDKRDDAPGLLWLFFGFSGRIARQSYTLSILFQIILFCLSVYWAVVAGEDQARLTFAGFAFMAVGFFNLWSSLALSVKRLNDVNLPWPLAILLFVPGINVLLILFLALRKSHPQTNHHGPPPFGEPDDISRDPPSQSSRFGR